MQLFLHTFSLTYYEPNTCISQKAWYSNHNESQIRRCCRKFESKGCTKMAHLHGKDNNNSRRPAKKSDAIKQNKIPSAQLHTHTHIFLPKVSSNFISLMMQIKTKFWFHQSFVMSFSLYLVSLDDNFVVGVDFVCIWKQMNSPHIIIGALFNVGHVT